MNGNQEIRSSRNTTIKILIPIIIIVAIISIWFLKNPKQINQITEDNPDFTLHVTDTLDVEQLKQYELPIIIDFGADSCIPCKEMAPVLKELNEELRGKAIIKFVDVWKHERLAEGYPIRVIPTQVFFDKEGRPHTPSKSQVIGMQMYYMKDTNEHVLTVHEGGLTKEEILNILKELGME